MIKVMDRQNKSSNTKLDLPDEERRVRIEVTLDRTELHSIGITSLASLAAFRFQTLQGRYFQFWLPTFANVAGSSAARTALHRLRQDRRRAKFLTTGVVGLKAMDDAYDRRHKQVQSDIRTRAARNGRQPPSTASKRKTASTLVAYKLLTARVLMALRHLGNRIAAVSMESKV